ncbi:MAG TPA: Fe-S oxidoreductase [Lachnospiraceae bacterium]|nr:Fe-S oxidoreductase [Lachnospiraceae bacterium]
MLEEVMAIFNNGRCFELKNLGFGMMRLPVISGPTDFDYEQLNAMVDAFLEAGYTYFDTSFVYHNGKSEEATRKALVERHPRNSFIVATKFPTFNLVPEEQIDGIFRQQLDNLGVDYIDYYLIHNIQTVYYDGYDGNGGIVKTTHLFDHARKWKEDGKIRHLGISFHSSAKLLDRVLTEHPEIEFVQIALNPIDWDSELVQAGLCYDVIRRHGRKVIIMEAVKGGGLAKLPKEAEDVLKAVHPDWSIASWAVRFCLEKDDVIAVLSGMSTLDQVKDNTKTSNEAQPFTPEEKEALDKAMRIYRESAPLRQSEIDRYKGLMYHGVPVTAILQAYSICQIQPDPGFSDDNNYLKNAIAEAEHVDFSKGLEKQTVIAADGSDITDKVEEAVRWLTEHTF